MPSAAITPWMPERLTKRQQKLLFWAVLALGLFARLWRFGQVPGGLNQDEAFAGYEAWSLLTTGMDTAGYRFPVYLTAWGSGMNALETYLLLPFVALFGLKAWVIRLPQLLVGLLSLPAAYDVAGRIWDRRTGLTAMLLLAICPWHVLLSRWGLESNLAPGFVLFGLFFFLRAMEKPRLLLLSAVCYGLSLYAYAAIWPVLPFLLLAQGVWAARRGKLHAGRYLLLSLLLLVLLALPLLLFLAVNLGWMAELRTPLFSVPRLLVMRSGELSLRSIPENLENLFAILWRQSDGLPWNFAGWYGLLYPVSLPFTLLGLLPALGERKRTAPLLLMLLGALALGALMQVNINRVNLLWLPLVFLTARGLTWFADLFRLRLLPLLLAGYLVLFAAFQVYYFTDYRQQIGTLFGEGLEQAAAACEGEKPVYLSREIYYPQLLVAVEMPADEFRESVEYRTYPAAYLSAKSIGRWHFGIDGIPDENAYYILSPWESREPFEAAGFTLERNGSYLFAWK